MSRARSILAWLMVGAGSALVAYPGVAYGTGALRQARLSSEVRTLIGPVRPPADTSDAGRHASKRPIEVRAFRPSPGDAIGVINIPSIGLKDVVMEGVSDQVLLTGPGHLPGTALPGSAGVSVLAAHRDAHFRSLKDVDVGDRVILRLPRGRQAYEVVSKRIAGPADGWVTVPRDRPVLRLVTCWPPNWIGPAPDRLVVSAVPVEAASPSEPSVTKTEPREIRADDDGEPLSQALTISTTGGALFPESALPAVGAIGAMIAGLAAFGAGRSGARLTWWFLPWLGGLGLTALVLLAAWAGPRSVMAG